MRRPYKGWITRSFKPRLVSIGETMYIEHVAIWTHRLEELRAFYETYFHAASGPRYVNEKKGFDSYFLTFASGARLELMRMAAVPPTRNDREAQFTGYIHIAIAVGSSAEVDRLTAHLREDGYTVAGEPRTTG